MTGGSVDRVLLGALERLQDGLVVFDAERRLVLRTRRFAELLRLDGGLWPIGTPYEDVAHDIAVACLGLDDEAAAAWVVARGEARGRGESATELPLRDGRRIRLAEHAIDGDALVGVATETTSLREGETALAESEQRFTEVLDSLPVAVSVKDGELRYLLANKEYEHLYGVREEEIVGLTPSQVLGEPSADVERRERHEREVIETGRAVVREAMRVDADGRQRRLLVEKTPFRDSSGGLVGVCSAITDVTELKAVEDELRMHRERLEELVEARTREVLAMQDDLLRSERLSAIGQLTATVAHELRHPLGTIDLSVQTIRRLARDGEPIPAHVFERIARNVRRADQTVGELLTYTQVRPLHRTPVALDALVASVLDEVEIPREIEVECALAPTVVAADDDRLTRAVSNVVTNAVQAMVTAETPLETYRLEVACGMRDGAAFVTVTDSGPGIPAEVRERMFEPLFSTKSFGTGLGLPLVLQIVEQHGGTIEVADGASGGAAVTIALPAEPVRTRD